VIVSSVPGELPPPAPRACFGRYELIEGIVGFAENLTPIAFIHTGRIGKASIALAVLHHDRVKQWFGQNLRFSDATSSQPRSLTSSTGSPRVQVSKMSKTPKRSLPYIRSCFWIIQRRYEFAKQVVNERCWAHRALA